MFNNAGYLKSGTRGVLNVIDEIGLPKRVPKLMGVFGPVFRRGYSATSPQ